MPETRVCFDGHLARSAGSPEERLRALGNALRDVDHLAMADWGQHLSRFLPGEADVAALPPGSWLLRMAITLAQPFTSKSEREWQPYEERGTGRRQAWFPLQNPISRDHLTGYPLVRPTAWKGHLRFAAERGGMARPVAARLFGESREDGRGTEGRLRFFPTFFGGPLASEVVTPLSRQTRTPLSGRGPIDFEVVPPGTAGTFCLLYVPLPKGPEWSPGQIADDLAAVGDALPTMLLDYGFSAKKTAGWGIVLDSPTEGLLWACGQQWPAADAGPTAELPPPEERFGPLMDANGRAKAELRKPDGSWLSNSEFRRWPAAPTSLGVYQRFRAWYMRHGEDWQRRLVAQGEPEAVGRRAYPITSVTGFRALAARLAASWRERAADA